MNRNPYGFGDGTDPKRERSASLDKESAKAERPTQRRRTEDTRTDARPTPQQFNQAIPPSVLLNDQLCMMQCFDSTPGVPDEIPPPRVLITGPTFAPVERKVALRAQGDPEGGTFTWSRGRGQQLHKGPQPAINVSASAKGKYTYLVEYELDGRESEVETHILRRYRLSVEGDSNKPFKEAITLEVRGGPPDGPYEWEVTEGSGELSATEGGAVELRADSPGSVTVRARCTLGGEDLYSDWVSHTVLFTGPAVTVTPCRADLTVVLTKDGVPWEGHPVLSFEIEGAELADHVFDVQVARGSVDGLSASPGPRDTWRHDEHRDVRTTKTLFSSWTAGERPTLDGSGKATFTMPVEWWVDLARLPLTDFQTAELYFHVLVMPPSSAQPAAASARGCVRVHNNLVSFDVTSTGYVEHGRKKSVAMTFQVREAGTSAMYTILQWVKGSSRCWYKDGQVKYGKCTDYDIEHDCNFPEWSLDRRSSRDPRYADGKYKISTDQKSATATDKPGPCYRIGDTIHHGYYCMDFQTRLYLNCEVPHGITLSRKDRNKTTSSKPDWGVIIGGINHKKPPPIILKQVEWSTRVLQTRDGSKVNVTHPDDWEP